jgi:hypothetical protein
MTTDDEAPALSCAACGRRLRPDDVVIVSREIVPSWASQVEPTTTSIFHQRCEIDAARADHNWTRAVPQTLSRALRTTESELI